VNPLLDRAVAMGRQLAQAWVNAAVYRIAWSLPLPLVIASAIVVVILLVLFGAA
jgi:hypothetical protein